MKPILSFVCSREQGWILGEANQAVVWGPPFFRDVAGPLFETCTLSFCIVLFKSRWTTLEPQALEQVICLSK